MTAMRPASVAAPKSERDPVLPTRPIEHPTSTETGGLTATMQAFFRRSQTNPD
jgi:hypothetical protein